MDDSLTLALWQTCGFPGDVAANLAALAETSRAAAAAGAGLLLCPECWLCGYNIGDAVRELAEARQGPSAQRIGAIAQEERIAIAYGYAERDPGTGLIYNAVQVLGPEGTALSHYRKTHLFGAAERAVYQPGERFEAPFDYRGFKIGLLICYDVEYPETVRSLALLGAELVLIPTALTPEYQAVPNFIVPARSVENQLYVAYCNHAGAEHGMQFLGASCLTGVNGEALVSAGASDVLIIGEISKRARAAAFERYPYQADRRPELYGLVSAGGDQPRGTACALTQEAVPSRSAPSSAAR